MVKINRSLDDSGSGAYIALADGPPPFKPISTHLINLITELKYKHRGRVRIDGRPGVTCEASLSLPGWYSGLGWYLPPQVQWPPSGYVCAISTLHQLSIVQV